MPSRTEPVRWLVTLRTPLNSEIQRTSYGRDKTEAFDYLKAQYPDWDNYIVIDIEELK